MVSILMNIPLVLNVVFDVLTHFHINHMMMMVTLVCIPLFYNVAGSLSLTSCKSWVLMCLHNGCWFWQDTACSASRGNHLCYLVNNEWNLKILNHHRHVVIRDLIFIAIDFWHCHWLCSSNRPVSYFEISKFQNLTQMQKNYRTLEQIKTMLLFLDNA